MALADNFMCHLLLVYVEMSKETMDYFRIHLEGLCGNSTLRSDCQAQVDTPRTSGSEMLRLMCSNHFI